ncbi:5-formyltetrahydrofolate cyclo-ligase [Micropruina sp.]|uniref:5-formyltetrahydrofolate cyclo-ligase n=1 Tax=Micropruina sp. TaxID=2737536 RepID=UPI0039E28EF9
MPEAVPAHAPMRSTDDAGVRREKAVLRARVRAARRVPEATVATARRTARALAVSDEHDTVALYASLGDEPDTWSLIDALHASGHTVLLPVLGRHPDGAARRHPDWARYAGRAALRVGYAGIEEPTTEALGANALSAASLVWCSGLAATPDGDRLGSGGGWYDRALTYAHADALIGVLLRDTEVLARVPVEPFDRRIGVIVTDSRTLRLPVAPERSPGWG